MDTDTALDQLAALRTPAGLAALAAAAAAGTADPLTAASRLRSAGHDPELAAAALTQVRLRERAATKFGADAASMFFTPNGVEQATRAVVAARRAARFAGAERVADLCCGIGADLVAFARAGLDVTGVDADPLTAAVARLNVAALGLGGLARVVEADATTFDLTGYDAAFCDPARRAGGRRVFDPSAYSPPWAFLLELAAPGAADRGQGGAGNRPRAGAGRRRGGVGLGRRRRRGGRALVRRAGRPPTAGRRC